MRGDVENRPLNRFHAGDSDVWPCSPAMVTVSPEEPEASAKVPGRQIAASGGLRFINVSNHLIPTNRNGNHGPACVLKGHAEHRMSEAT